MDVVLVWNGRVADPVPSKGEVVEAKRTSAETKAAEPSPVPQGRHAGRLEKLHLEEE